jgi:hypothetical protein
MWICLELVWNDAVGVPLAKDYAVLAEWSVVLAQLVVLKHKTGDCHRQMSTFL